MNTCQKPISITSKNIILFFFALLVCLALQVVRGNTASAYQHDNLIDDAVFLDAKSMSASQIQSFLDSKSGVLKSRSFKLDCDADGIGGTAKQLYINAGAPCGSTISAARIIYYTAQVYGVNPKVIIATLQKEQSLITDSSPSDRAINQAMGYACPTSGVCDSSSSFFWQIDNGTWVLRFHYERARKNNNWWYTSTSWTCGTAKTNYYSPNLYPRQNVKFYDPYSGIQYVTVNIKNAATSAFYCYTPHVFNNHSNSPHPDDAKNPRCYSMHPASGSKGRCYTGSYNFVKAFEQWFGSTLSSEKIRFILCNGQKYSVEKSVDRKRLMTDEAVTAWGLTEYEFIENDYECSLPSFTEELGLLLRSRDTGKVYLIDNGIPYFVYNQSLANLWNLGELEQTLPQFYGVSIKDKLKPNTPLTKLATSDNTSVTSVYALDNGRRYSIKGTGVGDKKILSLIGGTAGVYSVKLLQTYELNGELGQSFLAGSTWYVFDLNKVRGIHTSATSLWDVLLDGPSLSNDFLRLTDEGSQLNNSFLKFTKYYRLEEDSTSTSTSSTTVAQHLGIDDAPVISNGLADIINSSFVNTEIFGIDGNLRLIECSDKKYVVERGIRKKRSITPEAVNHWDFTDKYFHPNDRGCLYPSFSLALDRLVRSRNTGRVYYISKSRAFLVSKPAGLEWGFGNIDRKTYPLLEGSSVTDNLSLRDKLPPAPN